MIEKKIITTVFSLALAIISFAQTNAELLTVQLSATTQKTPGQITLDWVNDGSAVNYQVYRRSNTSSPWGSALSILGSTVNTYVDNGVSAGVAYEYRIVKSGATAGYGYINAAIELPEVVNKGILILVVEDTYVGNANFDNAINQTIIDIKNDGWFVKRINVNKTDPVPTVKSAILSTYNQNASLTKAIYLIGHVPVPYSGLLNPDGHGDHLGAWPTDSYYADVNGTWTDVAVNDNTSASQTRNHNIPGDGKFDQSSTGDLELQIGRVDFDDMPSFSKTEEELLIHYLNKAHDYKVKGFTANERALVDDNFASMTEGFSSSGLRNFSTMFTPSNITTSLDYRTEMNSNSYMWSYGCGAGSYTSCSGIGNTSNLSGDSLQTVFTMLFGSYFGDWDNSNNFLRASIAQGQTLNAFWAGRPHWQVHHMALGENIGFSSNLTQNNSSNYFVSTLSYFAKWVQITLLGDPTTRMTYITPPSNLTVVNNNNDAVLIWTSSPDNVLGYNVYRIDPGAFTYIKVNSSIILDTTFTDNTVTTGGKNVYVVKAVALKTTASGSYFNQSLGVRNSAQFSVGIDDFSLKKLNLYPNPIKDILFINGAKITHYMIYSINGKTVQSGNVHRNEISVNSLKKGIYIIELTDDDNYSSRSKIIIE